MMKAYKRLLAVILAAAVSGSLIAVNGSYLTCIYSAYLAALIEVHGKKPCLIPCLLVEILHLRRKLGGSYPLPLHFIITVFMPEKIRYLSAVFDYHLHQIIVLGVYRCLN